MSPQFITQQFDGNTCTITLNRPEKRNAFNPEMMHELILAIETASDKGALHYVLVRANGPCFSAGADLAHMQAMNQANDEENKRDAALLAKLLKTFYCCPHPLIMACDGVAVGGALGLLSCADYVIADAQCTFRLSEVSLGITPATIAPYLNQSLGSSRLLAYALSGNTFHAEQAYNAGLVHQISTSLDESLSLLLAQFKRNSPSAMKAFKAQSRSFNAISELTCKESIAALADVRSSDDAKEGLSAFFDKRPPSWVTDL